MKQEKKPDPPSEDDIGRLEKQDSEQARKDVTHDTLVYEAASILWKRALESKDDLLIGAAHVLHAVWIMLRTRGKHAQETMVQLEKLSDEYRAEHQHEVLEGMSKPDDLDELKRLTFCDLLSLEELPPRAGLDRRRNIATLVRLTDSLWQEPVEHKSNLPGAPAAPIAEQDLVRAASLFVYMVRMLFPDIATIAGHDIDSFAKKIAEAWERREKRVHQKNKKIDPELLVVDGLEVLGVKRGDVHNWLKRSARENTTGGANPEKREQERDTRGRFGADKNAPKN